MCVRWGLGWVIGTVTASGNCGSPLLCLKCFILPYRNILEGISTWIPALCVLSYPSRRVMEASEQKILYFSLGTALSICRLSRPVCVWAIPRVMTSTDCPLLCLNSALHLMQISVFFSNLSLPDAPLGFSFYNCIPKWEREPIMSYV